MAKNEKSKAEIYREERKARIAKAAKKNSKKTAKNSQIKKVVGKAVFAVICAAAVLLISFKFLGDFGVIARAQTALSVGEYKISVAEYSYMYYKQYERLVNQTYQYMQQYGYNVFGFDYSKSPEEQDSPYKDEDEKPIKWSDQLTKQTTSYFNEFYVLYDSAVKAGVEMDADDAAAIDEQLQVLRDQASGKDSDGQAPSMTLNSYLRVQYGGGINERLFRKMLERELVTQKYSEQKQTEIEDKYPDEVLDEEYKENPGDHDAVDLRIYGFSIETLTAEEDETDEQLAARQKAADAELKAKADAFIEAATDEAAFMAKAAEQYAIEKEAEKAKADEADHDHDGDGVPDHEADAHVDAEAAEDEFDADAATKAFYRTKSSLTSNISEDIAAWAFDSARKAGDKSVFETESAYLVVYLAKKQYPVPTVAVRHILFMTVDHETGEPLSDEQIAVQKQKSEDIYEEWKAGAKTEDSFAELANLNSEDGGSSATGGLYEGVAPGDMVGEFNDWIFDAKRKAGDSDIIESDYGYHIMYFVGNPSFKYRTDLRTSHTQDDYSAWLEEEMGKDEYKLTENAANLDRAYKKAYVLVNSLVRRIQG
ncbi:MAG: peptidylprolyl isomerase [Oscillospiraceae bacterium]|nr:peptidylprolyl isomerase [Oscillospiraceae bacterium]